MANSNVVILSLNMVTSNSLVEINVAHYQNRDGESYAAVLAFNLFNYWSWKSASKFQPEVQADGPYTAIKFSA
jgi:hypothetical protein